MDRESRRVRVASSISRHDLCNSRPILAPAFQTWNKTYSSAHLMKTSLSCTGALRDGTARESIFTGEPESTDFRLNILLTARFNTVLARCEPRVADVE